MGIQQKSKRRPCGASPPLSCQAFYSVPATQIAARRVSRRIRPSISLRLAPFGAYPGLQNPCGGNSPVCVNSQTLFPQLAQSLWVQRHGTNPRFPLARTSCTSCGSSASAPPFSFGIVSFPLLQIKTTTNSKYKISQNPYMVKDLKKLRR